MPTFTPLDAAAILITLAAILSWINHRFLKLPSSVGLALMGVIASLIIIGVDAMLPGVPLRDTARQFLAGVNFRDTLMNGMLSFLLFAGALHVNMEHLARGKWQVLVLSTLAVLASTLLVGAGFWSLASLIGAHVPLIWCFIFGALISPTDPVAVLGVMKSAPPALQATFSGEALFNDGVGVVVFSILLTAAMSGAPLSAGEAAKMFVLQAGGGAVLGLAIGWIAFRAIASVDDYPVELLITLAVVMGGYELANALRVSGPVAMAAAGLLIGNGLHRAMSEASRDYVVKFWTLIDEVLNAVLFLLIGLLGVSLFQGEPDLLLLGALAVPLVLAARALSVGPPLLLWRKLLPFFESFPVFVWGGLRGGISIAMALALPQGPERDVILTATYVVVLFSVLVQGATIQRIIPRAAAA